MTTLQIRCRLEAILEFMQPYWGFVNCHMVNYLTHQHWHQYVPQEIRKEVSSPEQVRQCIDMYFCHQDNQGSEAKFPAVAKLMEKCERQRLSSFSEILQTVQSFKVELGIVNELESKVSIKEFMTDKKRHEVELTAELINDLMTAYNYNKTQEDIFIVDAGDGKGYLSSRLALQYGHKVLGIDANQMNTENALERSRKLQRAWNGLVKRAQLIERGITPPRRGKKHSKSNNFEPTNQSTNYCTTARFIDSSLDITNLLQSHFPRTIKKPIFCLTGLHTCGNLAATCLRVFHQQPNCKLLCNIGCCYHFLKESFTSNKMEHSSTEPTTSEASFPMSNFLYEKQVKMGRNARMLAAQCIERTLNSRELPNKSLFYRALLEVIIKSEFPKIYNEQESIQVGRLRKFENFPQYITQCAKKTCLEELHLLEQGKILDLETIYADDRTHLELFYLLRMLFAPILETLILLDRLLYLKEQGYDRSYLVSVFDAIVSPRHYAIIAIKD